MINECHKLEGTHGRGRPGFYSLIVPYISQINIACRFEGKEVRRRHGPHHIRKTGLSVRGSPGRFGLEFEYSWQAWDGDSQPKTLVNDVMKPGANNFK